MSNNKEYMKRRRQQQLLTCNKGKLLTCIELQRLQLLSYHVLYINRKETINTFLKKRIFFSPTFALLVSSLSHTLLKLLLNNLHMLDVCMKVNVFTHKNINHIHNYVQKPIENCLFLLVSSFVSDNDCLAFL